MANKEQKPRTAQELPVWKEHTRASASASVFLSDAEGRLLMVQDIDAYGGKWSPIAGFVDVAHNEEPEMAAIREAKEELGLDVRLDELIGVWHYYTEDDMQAVAFGEENKKPDKAHMHIGYAYRGTILSGSYTMQKEEIQNYGFFTEEQFRLLLSERKIKTPQYNAVGYTLWREGIHHPLNVIQTKGRSLPAITL